MLEELLNSKMFWLVAASITGLTIGSIIKRLRHGNHSSTAYAMPVIGFLLTILILKFAKINTAYFQFQYTLMGVFFIFIIALLFGFMMYMFNERKISYAISIVFIYTSLAMVCFYIFYKPEQKINISNRPPEKDVFLLLKKEDAGYFEINQEGIGYIGSQYFINGFRPKFIDDNKNSYAPAAFPNIIEIPTRYGLAHAIWFRSQTNTSIHPTLDLDMLMEQGIVKMEELKFGDLKETGK